MLATQTTTDCQVITSMTNLTLVSGRGEPPVLSCGQAAGPSPWTGGVNPPLLAWALRRREAEGERDTGGRGGPTLPLVWDWCERKGAVHRGKGGLYPSGLRLMWGKSVVDRGEREALHPLVVYWYGRRGIVRRRDRGVYPPSNVGLTL